MAITRCGHCGKRTSTLVDRCGHCGRNPSDAPPRRRPSFARNMTLHYLLAAILFLSGAWMYGQAYYRQGIEPSLLSQVLLFGGLAWYAVARCASWLLRR